jgi:2-methylisocitrate lyase-like PEP mutase family enzyme
MANPIPPAVVEAANRQSERLRSLLHAPGILVMPGAYDTLSALLFEALGFPAIQGSSGAIAATFGLRDGQVLPRTEMVAVYRRMMEAVKVPVNADGEKGYGGAAAVAETVRQLVEVGAAGMNLEDSAEHAPGERIRLLPLPEQLVKLRAVLTTCDDVGSRFFLNARVDAFLIDDDPARVLASAIERGNAYAEVGADCIFYLNVSDPATIQTLVREVAAPVSILANARCPSIQQLADLGVKRVSYGSAFIRAALAPVRQLAEVLRAKGDPSPLLEQAFPGAELNRLLRSPVSSEPPPRL